MKLAIRLTLALVVLWPFKAAAADTEQVVYWPLVTDGAEYRRISYPEQAGALVVLADTTVILEARRAEVSYWPISREYVANLAGTPRPIEASVEIVASDGTVSTVEPQPYLVWHADGVGAGPATVVNGAEAGSFYADYVARAREAASRAQDYQRIVAMHQAAVESWLKIAAERPTDLPPPPPELTIQAPEPYRAFASEPSEAAVFSLPAGRYTVRLRDENGTIVTGSERQLTSLAPRARGVGYVVRPENRWTQPVVSFAPSETIYTTGQTDLFIQPVPVLEYEAQSYDRLFRPQSVESADAADTIWVPDPTNVDVLSGSELRLRNRGEEIGALSAEGFRVAQVPGRSRGYTIEPFEASAGGQLQPDFRAVRVPSDSGAGEFALVSGNAEAPGSVRPLRRVDPPPMGLLALPAFLPLAIGIALALGRRTFRRNREPALARG